MNNIERQRKMDEQELTEILQKHVGLTAEAKNEIADAIIDKICWTDLASFFGTFLTITALEIAKQWAKYNNIQWSADELKTDDCLAIKEEEVLKIKITEFCSIHNSSPMEQLKKTILRWIDEGMLEKHLSLPLATGFKTRHKKPHILTRIKKITKVISVIILTLTVIAFWTAAIFLMTDKEIQNVGKNNVDCNVANIKLYGDIYTYVKDYDECKDCVSSEDIVNQIRDAEANDDINAILLSIDSTGGWPVAAQEAANALKLAQKPTVALIRDAGSSAAYFAATGAARIFASSMASVGGIGITMSYLDNSKKNEKDGLTFNQLSIGTYKDTGNSDKSLSKEEKDLLMANLQTGYDIFVASVAENRNLGIDKVKALANGATMKGQKALDNGLVDQLGDLYDAEKYLGDMIGEKAVICR